MDKFVFAWIFETLTLTRLTFYLTFHCHTMISSWIRPLATTFMDAFAFSGYNQMKLAKKDKIIH
jgi:hypothetical protein